MSQCSSPGASTIMQVEGEDETTVTNTLTNTLADTLTSTSDSRTQESNTISSYTVSSGDSFTASTDLSSSRHPQSILSGTDGSETIGSNTLSRSSVEENSNSNMRSQDDTTTTSSSRDETGSMEETIDNTTISSITSPNFTRHAPPTTASSSASEKALLQHHALSTPPPPQPSMSIIDSITSRLLGLRGSPPGTLCSLAESEIKLLCQRARPILLSQDMLLQLQAPIKICGDVHGQFTDLLRLFEYGGFPPEANYLFLGDYVDRGKQSLETISLLLCYKIKYPEHFFILRGNHESAGINRIYGFYDECKRRYSIKLWKIFSDLFNCLPVSALVEDKILCMHGGLSPEMQSLSQIMELGPRPMDVPDVGLMCDLLWSDPDTTINGWAENDRGVSFVFGADVVASFLEQQDLDLLVRAHQVVEDGYEFFAGRRLVTLFSAPNYCGEFDNAGGMISVDENLMCSFQILKPSSRSARFANRNHS